MEIAVRAEWRLVELALMGNALEPFAQPPASVNALAQTDGDKRRALPFRPFQPGEKVDNPDGSFSTERTVTVQMPDGQWAVVPSLWMNDKSRQALDMRPNGDHFIANYAAEYELQSGQKFPRFADIPSAEKWAVDRSKGGGASETPLVNALRGQ